MLRALFSGPSHPPPLIDLFSATFLLMTTLAMRLDECRSVLCGFVLRILNVILNLINESRVSFVPYPSANSTFVTYNYSGSCPSIPRNVLLHSYLLLKVLYLLLVSTRFNYLRLLCRTGVVIKLLFIRTHPAGVGTSISFTQDTRLVLPTSCLTNQKMSIMMESAKAIRWAFWPKDFKS